MEKKGEACLGSFNVLNREMVLLANVEVEKQFLSKKDWLCNGEIL